MKTVFHKKAFSLLFLAVMLLNACQKEPSGPPEPAATSEVELNFLPVHGLDSLVFGATYNNSFLELYQVNEFKFYISNIELRDEITGDTLKLKNSFFLINGKDAASKKAQFKVPPGKYYEISFLIGVDSARNTSGAQSGALDPALGMFWTWSTGYIMAKFEGTSSASTQPGNVFEYHIGGFQGVNNVLRRVKFRLPATAYDFNNTTRTVMKFTADASDWFKNPHDLSITDNPVCTTPGALAMKYADNYAKMFTLTEVLKQ